MNAPKRRDLLATGTLEILNDDPKTARLAGSGLRGPALELVEAMPVGWGDPNYGGTSDYGRKQRLPRTFAAYAAWICCLTRSARVLMSIGLGRKVTPVSPSSRSLNSASA